MHALPGKDDALQPWTASAGHGPSATNVLAGRCSRGVGADGAYRRHYQHRCNGDRALDRRVEGRRWKLCDTRAYCPDVAESALRLNVGVVARVPRRFYVGALPNPATTLDVWRNGYDPLRGKQEDHEQ